MDFAETIIIVAWLAAIPLQDKPHIKKWFVLEALSAAIIAALICRPTQIIDKATSIGGLTIIGASLIVIVSAAEKTAKHGWAAIKRRHKPRSEA